LFLLSLEERKRDWIRYSCSPKSISSSIILIRDFLKHWGHKNIEETIQDLEDILQGCSFLSEFIEGLKETLLLKYDESTFEEEEIEDDSNEESFECLKENIQEDNEFCEQLLEHFHDKDFLVKFCVQRKKEYNAILQNYKRKPTLNMAWEVSISYFRVKSLCNIVTERYDYQEGFPTQDRSFLMPEEVCKLVRDQDQDGEIFDSIEDDEDLVEEQDP
jgi:hypothetical protein